MMKVGFVSLGCSKNLVVTEEIIGLFKKRNYEIVGDPADAEILLINTCIKTSTRPVVILTFLQ